MNSPISVRPQVVRDADLSGKRFEAAPVQTLNEVEYIDAVRQSGVHPLEFMVRLPTDNDGHREKYVKGVFINFPRGSDRPGLELPGLHVRAEEMPQGTGYSVKFGYQGDGMLTKDQVVGFPAANEAQAYLVSCSLAMKMLESGALTHDAMEKILIGGFDRAFGQGRNESRNGDIAALEIKPVLDTFELKPETRPEIRVGAKQRAGEEYGYDMTLSVTNDQGASESHWRITLLTKNDAFVKHVQAAIALEALSGNSLVKIQDRMEQVMDLCNVDYLL